MTPRTRTRSSLSGGLEPVRSLFREERRESLTTWICRLCGHQYQEEALGLGWPVSLQGLFWLVKHVRGHLSQ